MFAEDKSPSNKAGLYLRVLLQAVRELFVPSLGCNTAA